MRASGGLNVDGRDVWIGVELDGGVQSKKGVRASGGLKVGIVDIWTNSGLNGGAWGGEGVKVGSRGD